MKDNRPINLDIGTIRLPITAYASISHRISGVILVVASFLMLWALDTSLASADGFAALGDMLSSTLARLISWAILVALLYHSLAGVRHLIMDCGVGETLEGGILGARIVFLLTAAGAALLGVALW
ncbi:MAG: succinate dehydrogenase, cytochrome b556 subunit [Halieaceae bacterium]|nr:succinate dehydrogenase, cytochrome b556 subunit [Halieaceae bacterium]